MTAEETIASLEAQLKQALERLTEVTEQLTEATEQLRVAQARIEELEKLKTPLPAFVKAEKKKPPEEQKKARKKRDAKHNRARPRSTPTQIVEHRLLNCPACQMRLEVSAWLVHARSLMCRHPARRGDGPSIYKGGVQGVRNGTKPLWTGTIRW